MKKTILTILAVLILFSGTGRHAFAESAFDVSALQNSSSFDQRGDYWSIAGQFSGMADGYNEAVTVGAYLSSTYVSEGWGPELRVSLKKNAGNVFCEVTAFRATVNGIPFRFEALAYNGSPTIHAGYLFGGNVYRQFLEEMRSVKSASFRIDYIDPDGTAKTAAIDHVHTGELGKLAKVANELTNADAFSADTDPDGNDALYGASVGQA